MRKLSFVILSSLLFLQVGAQSPHGEDFTMDCKACHSASSWAFDPSISSFEHDTTSFPLTGQHIATDCKLCHTSLDFRVAETECFSCHSDVHQQTVGSDCARCHQTNNWLVEDFMVLHEQNGFPLQGAHSQVTCNECHVASDVLRFQPIGNACINCHQDDYLSTTSPDHQAAGYSTDCSECHNINAHEWSATGINHDFFPLIGGHDLADCASCHQEGSYAGLSAECLACHQPDFTRAQAPNHQTLALSSDCALCHVIDGWSPAEFRIHDDQFFPIYRGEHAGAWDNCATCHQQEDNLAVFTCLSCHEHNQNDMDNEHQGLPGYSYSSTACLACHPNGDSESSFDHNRTNFPLTGAPTTVECQSCHQDGFAGTSMFCADCHGQDFAQAKNPDHRALAIPNDCAMCHTTAPGWTPAGFPLHDEYYVLKGAHAPIASDCASCHDPADYSAASADCASCHQADYDGATNPNHQSSGFSTDCASCHSETAWQPADFDHDAQYFPIQSGTHAGAWSECVECHTSEGTFTTFNCLNCHEHNRDVTDEEHQGIPGYAYASDACLACHPMGTADGAFDHNATNFPLTGAHTTVECASCHPDDFAGTSMFCADCHGQDFAEAKNPDHQALAIPNDCAMCHTTMPGWTPASFPLHDEYYVLKGAHAVIAYDCARCHDPADHSTASADCASCHQVDYDGATNPNHQASGFSTDCASCHSETAWQPADFDHDAQFFPINSGAHLGVWSECIECHTAEASFATFNCLDCHEHNQGETDAQHEGITGYAYASDACLTCHPLGTADGAFDHNSTNFPLTGAHVSVECASCHLNGFAGTSMFCADCHNEDFASASNPNHTSLGLPNNCATCHTTEPGWSPASFVVHDDYYVLEGAHVALANDCASCHNGDYTMTPNTCAGCHSDEYNATTDPDHQAAGYSLDCAICHSQNAWQPANFDHDATNFPLTGAHLSVDCIQCHTDGYAGTSTVCADCHGADFTQSTNPNHSALGLSNDCASCHSTEPGWSPASFPVHDDYYVFAGAHVALANDCARCHNGDYTMTPNTCAGCHTDDYNSTTDPDHRTAGYSTDCATCHSQNAWQPASFDHNSTNFPLTGAHSAVDCQSCHADGYSGTSTLCKDCHSADFSQTSNPSHTALALSDDCASCHTTQPGWSPAAFPVHDNYYVLAGAHLLIANDCATCHNGDYNNTPNTCAGCHLDEYNNTNDPPHQASNFPTDCAACHGENAWQPATFDHDNFYFPIYSGKHKDEWNNCSDCHTNGNNYAIFSCIDCHEHSNRNEVDEDHKEVNGYQYLSTACLSCHPTGD